MTGAMQIESYRQRLEEFEQSLNRELYQYYAGLKEQLELTAVYSDYSDLLSVESIREVKSELENTGDSLPSRRKSLKKIHEFLVDQHLDFRAASRTQEIARFTAQPVLSREGRQILFAEIPSLLRNERDAVNRRKLIDRYAEAVSDLEALQRERLALRQSAAVALGFENYIQAAEFIHGIDCRAFLETIDEALARLEGIYLEKMRVSVEGTLGIALQDAGSWDVTRWQLQNDPPHVFSGKSLVPIVNTTISEMGIRPEREDAIELDLEDRPRKHARPFCIPIRVPHEIKIVLRPEAGSGQYSALLHESGHAHHFAWTGASLPIEHRIWGDRALNESYAFLLEHLLLEREWLARMLSYEKSREFLRFQSLYKAFLVRRCAGRLRFALMLHGSGSAEEASRDYAETMKAYTGLQHQAESWMADLSDGFDSADYLRGWIFECLLREYLSRRFGKAWFRSRSAAGFLKEIWETGQLYQAGELSRDLGIGNLEPQVLADELLGGLQN